MNELCSLLSQYQDGDLVMAAQIIEAALEAAGDESLSPEELEAIEQIGERFLRVVQSGDSDGLEADVKRWLSTLQSSDDSADEAYSTATEAERATESTDSDWANRTVHVEDVDIVSSFIQEAEDHLDDIESRVLKLETEYSPELVNTIFRSMHTIKGVAGFVGFTFVSELTHELETLLDEVRDGKREVSEELITVVLDGTDIVSRITSNIAEQVAANGTLSEVNECSFGHDAVVARVQALRDGGAQQPGAPAPDDAPTITSEMMDAFVEESSDLLDRVEQALLQAENDPVGTATVDQVFRDVHTIKGNAGFFWFAKVEQRCMAMETALDAFRKSKTPIDHAAATEFLEMLDLIRKDVQSIEAASLADDKAGVAAQQRPDDEPPGVSDTLGEILMEMGALDRDELESALRTQQRRLGEILVSDQKVPEEQVKKALNVQSERRIQEQSKAEKTVHRKDIRVDTNKLDKLFDLVGELITAESMVVQGIGGNGNGSHDEEMQRSVEKAASYLQKITREMQEITLSIRMIPLEATFGKMRRLVRDLSRKFEKKVNIVISGEQTEMDKNVIEEISDPLVHIIRNSVDHGVESPAVRKAAGKSETGTVWLSARHEGNEIWITIKDDGAGLSRERILKKAYERGLLSEGDPEPPDEEVWKYIFEPAFSTAAQVSEISGRGVGMDVVRQNIEKLRGKIDVVSVEGEGTTFVLRIPLTLAILDGVTFSIGETHYSVPTSELVTFQGYTADLIVKTEASHYGFRHRDDVIPIIQYERRGAIPEHGVIIVVHSNGRQAALVVDEIIGYRQFVVRSMPEFIQNMRAVSGCSIQGDGSVSFIIDVGDLMSQELVDVGSR